MSKTVYVYKDGQTQVLDAYISIEVSSNPIVEEYEVTDHIGKKELEKIKKKDINNLTKQGKLVKIK